MLDQQLDGRADVGVVVVCPAAQQPDQWCRSRSWLASLVVLGHHVVAVLARPALVVDLRTGVVRRGFGLVGLVLVGSSAGLPAGAALAALVPVPAMLAVPGLGA